ncbi:MAG TPA: hypothetical protein GXX75_09105 [Clostridiales bacterium]|nr:hypothetical protein [Clostridiales bacterium]
MSENSSLTSNDLLVILNTPNFSNLPKEHKKIILNSYGDNKKGVLDKMFGDNTERIPIYITFILCMSLILIATIFSLVGYITGKSVDLGLWSSIIPVITLALGYMFGKNNKKE